MNNLREVNNDILKDWLNFKEEELCSLTCDEGYFLNRVGKLQ